MKKTKKVIFALSFCLVYAIGLTGQSIPKRILMEVVEKQDTARFREVFQYATRLFSIPEDSVLMNSLEGLNHCEVLTCFSFLETHHLLGQKRYNQDQLFLYAAECENLKAAAQFFPERDINSVVNEERENAFMLACLTGNITLVKWLVEKQINVHALNKWGESALFYATKSNNFNLVKYLVSELGLDPNSTSSIGGKAVFYAIGKGNLEAVRFFFEEKKISVDSSLTYTFIRTSAFLSHVEIFNYLKNRLSFDVHERGSRGISLLAYVAHCGADISILKAIIELGCDVNAVDDLGETALFQCKSRPDITKLLLSSKARFDLVNKEGNTYAKEQIDEIISTFTFVNLFTPPDEVDTPIPTHEGMIETMLLLEKNGATANGITPVFYLLEQAIEYGAEDLLDFLFDKKYISYDYRDMTGVTLSQFIKKSKNTQLKKYFSGKFKN